MERIYELFAKYRTVYGVVTNLVGGQLTFKMMLWFFHKIVELRNREYSR